jgi:hypothetical protein
MSCLGRRRTSSLHFSASRAVGELDLPASRGCCAAAATLATAALRRRPRAREAAPCESLVPAGAAAGGYRIYRGHCRTLGGGSLRPRYRTCLELRSPFAEWHCRDLITHLSRVAWFRGARRGCGGWVAFIPLGSRGLQPGRVGCGSWVAAYVSSWGWG